MGTHDVIIDDNLRIASDCTTITDDEERIDLCEEELLRIEAPPEGSNGLRD